MSNAKNKYWSIRKLLKNSSSIGVPHFQRGYVWNNAKNKYWSIRELLKNSSSIGVPHFQRGYVWNEANISALLESLYFDTPCGNIVLWHIPNMGKSEDYGVPLTAKNSQNNITQFIIDGQQRTRSLLSVFCPGKGSTEAAGNSTENNDTEDKNDSDQSDENATDAQKHIPYVWAVNLARFAETVLDDKYKDLLDFPSHNPAGLFVKIRDPYKQKEAYIEYVKGKIKDEKNKTKQTITFSPEYRCQYNFIPLSFFFNLGNPANVTAKEEMQYNVVPYSSLSRSPKDYIVEKDDIFVKVKDENDSKKEPEEKKRLFDELPDNAIFIKYKGTPPKDNKLEDLINNLKSKLADMLTRQLAVRVLNTTDLSDVIHTFIRINSGGKAVQEEEKTLARLVQLSPEKTNDKEKKGAFSVLKNLFQKIHPGESGEINEHLQRLKENRFGFRLFIRVFVLAANYHTGKAMGTQAMSFSAIQNNELLESDEGKEKLPQIWECVKSVTMAVYDLLTEKLRFDTLAFLPDSRSLRPVFMLLIKYPKFMENNKIKDAYKPHMAYILLSLLLGAGDSEIDIMNFVTQTRNSPLDGCSLLKLLTTAPREAITIDKIRGIAKLENCCPDQFIEATFLDDCNALMTIWEKIRNAGNAGSLEDNLKKKFPKVNALTNRYILLLYVLERHLGAVDFYGNSLKGINDDNGENLDEKLSKFTSGRPIQAKIDSVHRNELNPPEKQHIVPYYWLHPENEGRKANDYANNIGNITYISHELNHYETGLGKYWLNLQNADNDLLKGHNADDALLNGHIISKSAVGLYAQMTPNTTISMAKDSDFDKWVKQRQEDIADAFGSWVEELRTKPLEKSENIPHARRLILPPNESSKENELVVRKFQWSDIMTEVWEWSELDDKQKLLVAALHNQSQCFIKSTKKDGKTTYKLLMRKPDGNVACLIEPFDISEVFERTRSKEKKSPQKDIMKQLAEKYHAGQFRKGEGNVPYIVHPESVAETLIRWGAENDSAAVQIAWGHDLLEDTTVSENEILAVSNERILQGIRLLTRPRSMDKAFYLQKVSASGDLDALLVKISDRICNSRDFVQLKGTSFAHQYLHEADCLIAALEKFSDNSMVQNALQEWNDLDETLRREAQGNAGALK